MTLFFKPVNEEDTIISIPYTKVYSIRLIKNTIKIRFDNGETAENSAGNYDPEYTEVTVMYAFKEAAVEDMERFYSALKNDEKVFIFDYALEI